MVKVLPDPVCPYVMMVTLKPASAASSSWVMPHARSTSACHSNYTLKTDPCFRSHVCYVLFMYLQAGKGNVVFVQLLGMPTLLQDLEYFSILTDD